MGDPGEGHEKVHLPDHGFWSGNGTGPTLSIQSKVIWDVHWTDGARGAE